MILLFGFGGVGRTYAELLYERTELRLCAVFDSGGGVAKKEGFTVDEVKQLLKTPRGAVAKSGVGRAVTLDEALDICQVVVDVSPPNYETAEPALSLYKKALSKDSPWSPPTRPPWPSPSASWRTEGCTTKPRSWPAPL
jgi:homoserine dehydrogenase